jgi:16S rRNA (guanine527-N7)-methyltransferase
VAQDFEAGRDAGQLDGLVGALRLPAPDAVARAGLLAYLERASRWNQKLDLTAARGPAALCEVVVGDALVLAGAGMLPEGTSLVDVGTGAGAPALPLLLLRPDLSALLIEPLGKRVAFLRSTVGGLGLAGRVDVARGRAESGALPTAWQGRDVAMSRATLPPPDWLALGRELAPAVLVFGAAEPLPPAPPGMALAMRHESRLPSSGAPRQLGLYRGQEVGAATC